MEEQVQDLFQKRASRKKALNERLQGLRDQLKSEFESVIERRRINIQAKIEELHLQIGSIIISKATPEKSLS